MVLRKALWSVRDQGTVYTVDCLVNLLGASDSFAEKLTVGVECKTKIKKYKSR
jgi:hypothetical protein